MLRYGAVHPEYYGLLFGGKIRPADRSFHALNTYTGPVNNIRHDDERVSRRSPTAAFTPWDNSPLGSLTECRSPGSFSHMNLAP